jgi:ribose-phosphate pyrophosphokinase
MYKIFALNSSKDLSKKLLVDGLSKLGNLSSKKFSDMEIKVEINETIRGRSIVLVSSLNTSDDIIEFMMAGDAAHRAGAKEVIALIPYIAYMRQDRKDVPRTAIGAKVIAKMIELVGVDQLITLDLHAEQIEGFFEIPVTHLHGRSVFYPTIKKSHDLSDFIVVSPDVGGAKRAKKFASKLGTPLAIINKDREVVNEVSKMELMGDVRGKKVILVDDMVDTAGSLCKASDLVLKNGATEVFACITHGVLSGSAIDRIKESSLTKLYISDSIKLKVNDEKFNEKVEVVSSAPIFAKALKLIKTKRSINKLIDEVLN